MIVFAVQYFLLMTFGVIAFWRFPVSAPVLRGVGFGDSLVRYRRSMLTSYVYEALAAAAALATGNGWLFLGSCLLMSAGLTWHRVGLAARVAPSPVVVRAFAARLEPRARRTYRSISLEIALAIATAAAAILILTTHDATVTTRPLAMPAMIFYIYIGLVLARRAAVEARFFPVPTQHAEQYFALQEGARRLILIAIDWLRALAACLLLCWSLLAAGIFSDPSHWQALSIPCWILYLMAMLDMSPRLWGFLVMKQSLGMPSEPTRIDEKVRGLFRWNPDSPAMMVRGPKQWALNLADRRTQLWVAYIVGLAAVIWIGVIA